MKGVEIMKPRCGVDINCGGECNCEDCPAKWIPKNPECESSAYIDCDRYNTCDECPHKGPSTWPRKENLHILLELSTKEKVMAFSKRYVSDLT